MEIIFNVPSGFSKIGEFSTNGGYSKSVIYQKDSLTSITFYYEGDTIFEKDRLTQFAAFVPNEDDCKNYIRLESNETNAIIIECSESDDFVAQKSEFVANGYLFILLKDRRHIHKAEKTGLFNDLLNKIKKTGFKNPGMEVSDMRMTALNMVDTASNPPFKVEGYVNKPSQKAALVISLSAVSSMNDISEFKNIAESVLLDEIFAAEVPIKNIDRIVFIDPIEISPHTGMIPKEKTLAIYKVYNMGMKPEDFDILPNYFDCIWINRRVSELLADTILCKN